MSIKTVTLLAVFRTSAMSGGVNLQTERFTFQGLDPVPSARKAMEEIECAFDGRKLDTTVKCIIIEDAQP